MNERLVSLISGGGTTMDHIVRAVMRGEIKGMDVAGIIASNRKAGGIAKARALAIPEERIVVVNPRDFRRDGAVDAFAFGDALLAELRRMDATVVTQNGWLPHTPEAVLKAYAGRMFNQHPGHPVEFGGEGMYGLRVHAAILEFQKRVKRVFPAYVVAQHVDRRLDAGSTVQSAEVTVAEGDTPESLQARCLPREHDVQITLLQAFVGGRLREVELPCHVGAGELGALMEAKQEAIRRYPRG